MTREEIINNLTPLVREVFQNSNLVLTDDLSAENVETWTSLAFMQLLTSIEEQFGFKFKMMELLKFKNMGNILDSMEQHLA